MASKSSPTPSSTSSPYITSVDLVRGLVMVLMALDHVRGFFTDADFSSTDLARTTPAIFLTRWITHLCAPTFVFLAGTSAFLSASQGMKHSRLAKRLFLRGLWLVFLELTVVRFAWFFNLDYSLMDLQVIWALGWSMIALAALVYLPLWAIAGFGIGMILGHNLLDGIQLEDFQIAGGSLTWQGWLLSVLHIPHFPVVYPLIPWIGVMAAGYAFGPIMLTSSSIRRKSTLALSATLFTVFVILRALNIYGDPDPWVVQETSVFTLLSFLNTTKYPPSLLYLLMTLGLMLLLISAFEWWHEAHGPHGAVGRFLITFGRVPLFFYLIHLYFIHALALLIAFAMGADISSFMTSSWEFPPWWGFSLPIVYLVWVGVTALLYPVCRRFAAFKSRHRGSWWTPYI
ncbi:MAG TPA: heparan-alpha-glucosaminide N-acetyltransferase domain-containing protein [Nitrosospira sp.]|nr:heparan-alpha-glucosaminide N-acetyltransferase domain-containing protein [Nitrosospira sp.]